jgi:hypothetical protein
MGLNVPCLSSCRTTEKPLGQTLTVTLALDSNLKVEVETKDQELSNIDEEPPIPQDQDQRSF